MEVALVTYRCFGWGAACIITGVMALSGCGPSVKEWEPNTKIPEVYPIAFRQLAPDEVYSRTRWVHLPEVMPDSEVRASIRSMVAPIYSVQLKNVPLEVAARTLASAVTYTSYTASTIRDRKVSITALGTIDELAHMLSSHAGVEVVVDHLGRHLSFLARLPAGSAEVLPRFLSPQDGSHEY